MTTRVSVSRDGKFTEQNVSRSLSGVGTFSALISGGLSL